MKSKILSLFLLSLSYGCQSNYWENRANDLTDFAHIDFEAVAFGVQGNASALSAGLFTLVGPGDGGMKMKYGLGGRQDTNSSGDTIILGITFYEDDARSRWGYGKDIPHFASVGVDLGIFFGLGVRVDVMEFFDLLLGFAEVDFMEDDKGVIEPLETEAKKNRKNQ
ncbi:MAG: hypothetical protein NE328_17280 [Lentisphaeraceae bacterium]|nr:hypothetical protein [Lentisphaeraceae bacterium]